jgi:amidase
MPTNYNAIHGYGFNPYDPRRDPRSTADGRPILAPGGSSSGIGTAANFWAGNVGTETSGSILTPANQNMLAAIKPTVGRISRYGVIPITADQDTPGPMAKYVRDAAIMFGVLESASADPHDEATRRCAPPPGHDYTKFLTADGLKGARIGIPRASVYEPFTVPGTTQSRGGLNPSQMQLMKDAIAALAAAGAVIVDPVVFPSLMATDPQENVLTAGSSIVLSYGMKRDFNAWLASLGPAAPVRTLTELREWNKAHERTGAIKYGQTLLDASDALDLEKDRARYEEARARELRVFGTNGIDAVMKTNNLDALLFPGAGSASVASKPGYPTVMVPFGMVPNAAGNATPASDASAVLPAGFDPKPQPFGVGFTGTACSEPRLLQIAYAFEQATKKRTPPPGLR